MSGRAVFDFILEAIGQKMGVLDDALFSIIVFSTFLLNLFAIVGLRVCAGYITKNIPVGN